MNLEEIGLTEEKHKAIPITNVSRVIVLGFTEVTAAPNLSEGASQIRYAVHTHIHTHRFIVRLINPKSG